MYKHFIYTPLITGLMLFVLPFESDAASTKDLIQEGNVAYLSGEYDKALAAYEEASVDAPESPFIYFNKGTALYKKGDYSSAIEAFEKAALKSKDLALEAKAKFNLGNCLFREAERQSDSDLNKSLEACQKSIAHYQESLELDPDLTEAAENIEVVRLVMKNILDEINKRKEEAKQQQEAMEETEQGQQGEGAEQEQQGNQQEQQQASPSEEYDQDNEDQEEEQASFEQLSDDADDILDEEKENRKQRDLQASGSYKEVDRDW